MIPALIPKKEAIHTASLNKALDTFCEKYGFPREHLHLEDLEQKLEPGEKAALDSNGKPAAKLRGMDILISRSLHIKELEPKLFHEIAHSVYHDYDVQRSLVQLFSSLPQDKLKTIEKDIKQYPPHERVEEKRVRALELLSKTPNNLFEKLMEAILQAWNKLTNGAALNKEMQDVLIQSVVTKGIEKIKTKKIEDTIIPM
jgi:hypothetical protein